MTLRFEVTELPGVVEVLLDPRGDERGWFARAWCREEFAAAGFAFEWEQANLAHNPVSGTLRGIHLQRAPHAEAKLVRCTQGRLFDVAVDLRRGSPAFGRWTGRVLSADDGQGLLIPPGCGHGYLTLEPDTDLYYQTSAAYQPGAATGVRYDDPAFGVVWPAEVRLVSSQDRSWPLLGERDDL